MSEMIVRNDDIVKDYDLKENPQLREKLIKQVESGEVVFETQFSNDPHVYTEKDINSLKSIIEFVTTLKKSKDPEWGTRHFPKRNP